MKHVLVTDGQTYRRNTDTGLKHTPR